MSVWDEQRKIDQQLNQQIISIHQEKNTAQTTILPKSNKRRVKKILRPLYGKSVFVRVSERFKKGKKWFIIHA